MSFLKSKSDEPKRNRPTESAVIEQHLQADLWVSDKGRIAWCLSRCRKDNNARGYRTLLPQHVGEAVAGVELLSRVFAGADILDDQVRAYCLQLSEELRGVGNRVGRVLTPEVAKTSNLLGAV